MFEAPPADHAAARSALAAMVDARLERRLAEVRQWQAAADFAETFRCHADPELAEVLQERFEVIGGEGTPRVSEFAALEVGAALCLPTSSANALMAAALDLRHRLPHSCQLFANGHLEAWVARELTLATRDLPADRASWVDERFARQAVFLPAGRQRALIEALVIDADPDAAARREREREGHRYVRISGMVKGAVHLEGRLDVLDAHQFDAMTDRLADVLSEREGSFNKDALRAKAVGVIANPVKALHLLREAAQPALTDDTEALTEWAGPDTNCLALLPTISEGAANAPRPSDDPDFVNAVLCGPEGPVDVPETITLGYGLRTDWPEWMWLDDAREPLSAGELESLTAADRVPEQSSGAPSIGGVTCGADCGWRDERPDRLLPKATLHVHISWETFTDGNGVARVEDFGAMTWQNLAEQLGDAHVTVRPVVDLNQLAGVDRYEIPHRLRNAVIQRDLHEAFPGSTRRSKHLDLDHTEAWTPRGRAPAGAAPPQTRVGNLAPLSRRVHRAKTAGLWRVRQPAPGYLEWTSHLGLKYRVAPNGSAAIPATRE